MSATSAPVPNQHQQTSGVSQVTISAGGVGIWVCVACCAATMVGTLIGCFWLNSEFQHRAEAAAEQNRRMDRLETKTEGLSDYLQAIYAIAPSLKPAEKEK